MCQTVSCLLKLEERRPQCQLCPRLVQCCLCGHVGSQHFGKFVILQAALQELFFRQTPVIVLIHPVEDILCPLLRRVGGFDGPSAQHVVDGLDDLSHLFLVDHTISIDIVHPERPFELLLRRPRRRHVDGEKELLEIDESIFVGVESAEDVVTELFCVTTGEEQLVHVNELGRGEPAVGTVLLEALVPLFNRILVVSSVGLEELQILLAEALLALDAAHGGGDGGVTACDSCDQCDGCGGVVV